jgi:hypothetical protein
MRKYYFLITACSIISLLFYAYNQICPNSTPLTIYAPVNRSKILIVTIALGDHWYKPLVKANRENYCKKHGYDLLFLENSTTTIEYYLYEAWSKISEGLLLLNESSAYEWLFFTDLDLFIMNLDQKLENIIDKTVQTNMAISIELETDFIIAKDSNGFNTGSFLVRNCNYTRYIFQEIWQRRNEKNIPHIDGWYEQAVFMHLAKKFPEMNSHIARVKQKVLNAYSNNHYRYFRGDFILHFPGPSMKKDIPRFAKKLVELQPELKPINDRLANISKV